VPLELDLLAAGADVRREALLFEQAADSGEVIGLVEAKALGALLVWLGTLDRDRIERPLQQEVVVAVGA
jgi:hypothetical protein